MRAILIDDDRDILDLYKEFLQEIGLKQIETVSDPANYFKRRDIASLAKDYDIVFCDINMPRLRGDEIFHKFIEARKQEDKFTRFVFITGVGPEFFTPDKDGWGSLVEADDILSKPINTQDLSMVLKKQGLIF